MNEINSLIKKRFSPLAFSSKQIEDEKMELLFEAARWASSSYNEQPWRFIYAKREDELEFNNVLNCIIEFNQEWAKNAGALILVSTKTTFTMNNSDNRHAFYDAGAAVTNLCLQASDLDLYVRQMAGFNAEKAQADLNVPEEFECAVMLAVGYLGDNKDLSEELLSRAEAPRVRKSLDEIRNRNNWFK